ncbi:MAG TPA: CHY zinc finger protein [Caulobacteraceae bacterium]|jgi:uncharacterized CHY-type Zn-finger protein
MTRPTVHGLDLDPETRCAHWHSSRDIVAIRMRCCGAWYACRDCHDAMADHPAEVWPRETWATPAILCGACKTELSIAAYMACGDQCPSCAAPFNPACRTHYHLYFESDG